MKRNVRALCNEDFSDMKVTEPVRVAAGVLGVKEALRHTFKEMGVVRSMKSLLQMNQEKGFDCPSCAWPDPERPSKIGEFCENGAKALADEATRSAIGADFFAKHSVEELSQLSDYDLNAFGRLTQPLVLRADSIHYEPISWPEAYQLIADELKKLDNPNEAIFYTSGRSSNEAAFLYGQMIRAYGTNNMPDCSNMCHESSGSALTETLGIGKGSVTLDDLYGADVIIVAGQNPGTNHPRMLSALAKCRANGGHVVSINPLKETGLMTFKNPQEVNGWIGSGDSIADMHLQVAINQDLPLMKLVLKKLVALDSPERPVLDHDFIAEYTDGYEALISDLDAHTAEDLIKDTGLTMSEIDAFVELLAGKSNIIVCWAMGLTQHENGVATIREFVNLLLLKGAIGKPHAGTCPVRGHSNVQGDRSVGIMHYVDPGLNDRIKQHMGYDPPTEVGYDTMEALEAMHEGKAKFFMALGGNFLMACPDTLYTATALEQCNMTVQVSTKLNRSHLVTGKTALILPTYGRSEKEGNKADQYITVESSTGYVKRSRGLLHPISDDLMSEAVIIAGIADAYFGTDHPVAWRELGANYDLIREKIDLVAKGFDHTSAKAQVGGYYLPNNARDRDFSKLPGGKAKITVNPVSTIPLEDDELMLMTIRSHDQFNTTIYGMDDRYRGIYNERRVIFMNEADMAARGLQHLQVVDLTSTYDGEVRGAPRFKVIKYDIPRGNAAAYFPETNVLVPISRRAKKSGTPISKSVRVRVMATNAPDIS